MTRRSIVVDAARAAAGAEWVRIEEALMASIVPGTTIDPWTMAILMGQIVGSASPEAISEMRIWPLSHWTAVVQEHLRALAFVDEEEPPDFAPPPGVVVGLPIPAPPPELTTLQREAWIQARTRGGELARGLGNYMEAKTGEIVGEWWDGEVALIEADPEQHTAMRELIRRETAAAIAEGKTAGKLASILGNATGDWSRNWDRIARTELQAAHNEGVLIESVRNYGQDARIARVPESNACVHCRRLFLTPEGTPRIFSAEELVDNGTNAGRKAKDWQVTLWPIHPNCAAPNSMISLRNGVKRLRHVQPGDSVLTHRGRFRTARSVWRSLHAGPMTLVSRPCGDDLLLTPNHRVLTACGWVRAEDLGTKAHVLRKPVEVDGADRGDDDANDLPPRGNEEPLLASILSGFLLGGVPVTAIYFDGDLLVGQGDIYEVPADHVPGTCGEPRRADGIQDTRFVVGCDPAGLTGHDADDVLLRAFPPARRLVGGSESRELLGWLHERGPELHGLDVSPVPPAPGGPNEHVRAEATDPVSRHYLLHREQRIEVKAGGEFRRQWRFGRADVICRLLGYDSGHIRWLRRGRLEAPLHLPRASARSEYASVVAKHACCGLPVGFESHGNVLAGGSGLVHFDGCGRIDPISHHVGASAVEPFSLEPTTHGVDADAQDPGDLGDGEPSSAETPQFVHVHNQLRNANGVPGGDSDRLGGAAGQPPCDGNEQLDASNGESVLRSDPRDANFHVEVKTRSLLCREFCHGQTIGDCADECKPMDGPLVVYNLTVQEDESYVANGIVVHNCACATLSIPPGTRFNEDWTLEPDA